MIEKIIKFLEYILLRWQNRQALKTLGGVRSNRWPAFRKEQIKLRGGKCELCGGIETLELHHIKPFHLQPELELDPNNVVILCESGKNGIVCHRATGHLGNYQSINVDCVKDVKCISDKIKNRP